MKQALESSPAAGFRRCRPVSLRRDRCRQRAARQSLLPGRRPRDVPGRAPSRPPAASTAGIVDQIGDWWQRLRGPGAADEIIGTGLATDEDHGTKISRSAVGVRRPGTGGLRVLLEDAGDHPAGDRAATAGPAPVVIDRPRVLVRRAPSRPADRQRGSLRHERFDRRSPDAAVRNTPAGGQSGQRPRGGGADQRPRARAYPAGCSICPTPPPAPSAPSAPASSPFA